MDTTSTNYLGNDIVITGTVKYRDSLQIHGKIEGEISSPGSLTVGPKAEITGEIHTGSASVQGSVLGNITVQDLAAIDASAQVVGDIKAARMKIAEGAAIDGKLQIGAPSRK